MRCFAIFAASLLCHTLYADFIFNLDDWCTDYPQLEFEEESLEVEEEMFDFDSFIREFILVTKKIELPEYPGAFNPSIVKWRGLNLMSFRFYNPNNGSTNPFAIVQLDDQFEPVGTPQVFELPFNHPIFPSKQQDPRLISVGNRLFVVFNNIPENATQMEMRRMCISELFFENEKFTATQPEFLNNFEGDFQQRFEKNWVPFDYNGKLLLGYSLAPHRILTIGKSECETVALTKADLNWDWGIPRGGTPAVLDNDQYLAFFHSWKDIPSRQSNGRKISHYVMGAYTFQAHPPFAITAVSPEPIVAENFYTPPYYKTWKPLRCVFPAGLIIDKDYAWLSYGRQDHEIWIAKLDKKKLLQSLVPVAQE